MSTEYQNRRKFPRLGINYSLSAQLETQQINLSTVNLSFGGAFLKSEQMLPVGITITLILDHAGETIEAQAKIIHRDRAGFAVTFLRPSPRFTAAVCTIISRQIMENSELGPQDYGVPGRIAVLVHEMRGSQLMFTSNLGERGIWLLTDEIHAYADLLCITLLEHGLFECDTQVIWCTENFMALEFIDPSDEFRQAYKRIFNSFII